MPKTKPSYIGLHKLPLAANQSVTVTPPKHKVTVIIKEKGDRTAPPKPKRCISSHPSAVKPQQQQQHTFCVQRCPKMVQGQNVLKVLS